MNSTKSNDTIQQPEELIPAGHVVETALELLPPLLKRKTMPFNIVLAHGILGFGNFTGLPILQPLSYFNGVANHLKSQGHQVWEPSVDPIGSVLARGQELGQKILALQQNNLKIIAHSMGGLDARYALKNVAGVAACVDTLVTIGTPHLGSPVADALANPSDPLFKFIPLAIRQFAGALNDLTTAAATSFNNNTPDVAGVKYRQIAGDASLGGHELFLFQLSAAIGSIQGNTPNDGLVTETSALRGRAPCLPNWPVDHGGEIGWSFDTLWPIDVSGPLTDAQKAHLARYDAIVSNCF